MKSRKKLKDGAALGLKLKKDKSLDKLSGKVLFPEKLKEANRIITKMKWKD